VSGSLILLLKENRFQLSPAVWRTTSGGEQLYCPKCGLQNQDELKFCTRCGTNVGIVADALSGKFDAAEMPDEKEVKLLTDYYRGRRGMILGFLAIVISVFKLTITSLLGNPESFAWFTNIFTILTILGLIWFVWGITKWNNCSSALKALGYDHAHSASPKRKKRVERLPEGSTVMSVKNYATDSLKKEEEVLPVPPSVTESTTRFLEEEKQPAPVPRKVSN
jgi:hypothetical protein